MAKLIAVVAALVVLLAIISKATAYRTTIVTSIIDDENQGQSQRCRQQMQMMQLQQCKNCMMSQMGQGTFNRVALKMVMQDGNQQMGQHGLQQCCMELQRLSDECRCEAIKQMMMQQMQEMQEQQGTQMEKMMQQARNLPRMCNMRPYQCQF